MREVRCCEAMHFHFFMSFPKPQSYKDKKRWTSKKAHLIVNFEIMDVCYMCCYKRLATAAGSLSRSSMRSAISPLSMMKTVGISATL